MKTRLARWFHSGFHGVIHLGLRVPADATVGDEVPVSRATAQRLTRALCGIKDCLCGESVAWGVGDERYTGADWRVTLPANDETVEGVHPYY